MGNYIWLVDPERSVLDKVISFQRIALKDEPYYFFFL